MEREGAVAGHSNKRRKSDSGVEKTYDNSHTAVPERDHSKYHDKDGHYIIKLGEAIGEGSRYKMLSLLGEGTFGKVVEVFDRVIRVRLAAKIIKAVPKYRHAAKIELRVLAKLKESDPHDEKSCVRLIDWFDFRDHICMIFKKLGLSIFDHLTRDRYKPFDIREVRHMAVQTLQALEYIHSCGLTHTDLKPENILFDCSTCVCVDKRCYVRDSKITIIDFGSATFRDEHHTKIVSTRHYRAPEVILEMGWGSRCDIWSLGCILVEIATGHVLFQTHDNMEHLAMMEKILGPLSTRFVRRSYRRSFFTDDDRLDWPKNARDDESISYLAKVEPLEEVLKPFDTTGSFLPLIKELLWYDAQTRPTAADARKIKFIRDFDAQAHSAWLESRWQDMTKHPEAIVIADAD